MECSWSEVSGRRLHNVDMDNNNGKIPVIPVIPTKDHAEGKQNVLQEQRNAFPKQTGAL